MLDKFTERYKAKSSKIGVIFHTWVAGFLLLCSAIGGCAELIGAFPSDWVPSWIKVTIVVSAIISHVGGKMTKSNDNITKN